VADGPFDEGTLRAETALMERALAALEMNDFDTARRELNAHAARFPNGHLKPERESALGRMLAKETKP
jgi:TolA-binding protein